MTAADLSLQGMRVLVTRPRDRAHELLAAIRARGGEALHIPLMTIVALDATRDAAIWQRTQQCVLDLDRYRRVIAISVNAAHYALSWVQNYWPQLPVAIAWYGIGAATAAALREHGIACENNGSAAMNSEALLNLSELQHVEGERILILRGVGGRETLASVLRERGASVDYAEFYRRIEPVLDAAQQTQLQSTQFDAICVNSEETLRNLWQCLSTSARHGAQRSALIVPSARVAAVAQALGFARVLTAANAGTEATLAALSRAATMR